MGSGCRIDTKALLKLQGDMHMWVVAILLLLLRTRHSVRPRRGDLKMSKLLPTGHWPHNEALKGL